MLKKFFVFFIVSVTIFSVSGVVGASMLIPAADQAKDHAMAPEKSPVITESGGDWWLERVDFIHYIKPTSPGKPAKSDNCYKLMGVKWTTLPVGYVINPTNPQGLDQNSITSEFSKSVETWDGATSADLFGNYAVDYGAQYGVQDYKNAIDFGNYPQSGVIAVTSVWYTRLGKKIVEFDIRFNTDFVWGDATVNPLLMDFENIATHELGHAVGLSDIYSTSCTQVTMYGYSTEGDTAKRTLEQPDITGLTQMYGI